MELRSEHQVTAAEVSREIDGLAREIAALIRAAAEVGYRPVDGGEACPLCGRPHGLTEALADAGTG